MAAPRSSAEIREAFLSFFEARDHRRMPSASLIPSSYDPSVLLTTAGMQPFKPYFLGQEQPPHPRLTSCQKCFRTTDIDQVGLTARHLTFFEMLGNFSFGDYFKQEAVEFAWELSLDVYGLDPERIWITVFEGDPELGLGPDEEAIECWRSVGVPGRAHRAAAAVRELLAGGAGRAVRALLRALLRPGPGFRWPRTNARGTRPSASSSTGTSSSCSTRCRRTARWSRCRSATSTPASGLDRMAAIQQDVPSVFETDQFTPARGAGGGAVRSPLRIGLRDHQGAARARRPHARDEFLIADGVVPSNEDRGYILRRVMRRAIQQGRSIGLEPPFLGRFADLVIEVMGRTYPELRSRARVDPPAGSTPRRRASAARSSRAPGCSADLVERAKAGGTSWIDARGRLPAARHVRLPLRPHARAAPGGGPVRGRRRLPRADGGAARARAHGRRPAPTARRTSTSR